MATKIPYTYFVSYMKIEGGDKYVAHMTFEVSSKISTQEDFTTVWKTAAKYEKVHKSNIVILNIQRLGV